MADRSEAWPHLALAALWKIRTASGESIFSGDEQSVREILVKLEGWALAQLFMPEGMLRPSELEPPDPLGARP